MQSITGNAGNQTKLEEAARLRDETREFFLEQRFDKAMESIKSSILLNPSDPLAQLRYGFCIIQVENDIVKGLDRCKYAIKLYESRVLSKDDIDGYRLSYHKVAYEYQELAEKEKNPSESAQLYTLSLAHFYCAAVIDPEDREAFNKFSDLLFDLLKRPDFFGNKVNSDGFDSVLSFSDKSLLLPMPAGSAALHPDFEKIKGVLSVISCTQAFKLACAGADKVLEIMESDLENAKQEEKEYFHQELRTLYNGFGGEIVGLYDDKNPAITSSFFARKKVTEYLEKYVFHYEKSIEKLNNEHMSYIYCYIGKLHSPSYLAKRKVKIDGDIKKAASSFEKSLDWSRDRTQEIPVRALVYLLTFADQGHDIKFGEHFLELETLVEQKCKSKEISKESDSFAERVVAIVRSNFIPSRFKTLEEYKEASRYQKIATLESKDGKLDMQKVFSLMAEDMTGLADKVDIQHKDARRHSVEIKKNEEGVLETKEELAEHKEILDVSGVTQKASIRKAFDELEQTKPEVFNYANYMCWTLSDIFIAYRSIATGAVQGRKELDAMKFAAKAGFKAIAELTSAIPVVGGAIVAVAKIADGISELRDENEIADRARIITTISRGCRDNDDLTVQIGEASLALASLRSREIESGNLGRRGSNEGFFDWIKRKVDELEDSLIDISLQDSPGAKFAAQDLAVIMPYLFTHGEAIAKNKYRSLNLSELLPGILTSVKFDEFCAEMSLAIQKQEGASAPISPPPADMPAIFENPAKAAEPDAAAALDNIEAELSGDQSDSPSGCCVIL